MSFVKCLPQPTTKVTNHIDDLHLIPQGARTLCCWIFSLGLVERSSECMIKGDISSCSTWWTQHLKYPFLSGKTAHMSSPKPPPEILRGGEIYFWSHVRYGSGRMKRGWLRTKQGLDLATLLRWAFVFGLLVFSYNLFSSSTDSINMWRGVWFLLNLDSDREYFWWTQILILGHPRPDVNRLTNEHNWTLICSP